MTNTNAALRTIADWPITDPANMDAVNMAAVARAALATAAAQPCDSITDAEIDAIAEGMPGGIDGFLKGWGWRQFARAVLEYASLPEQVAAAPKAEPVPAEEYPPLPAPFIGVQDRPYGGHAEVIRSAIGEDGVVSCYTDEQMRAYVDADRAMLAQAAPAAAAATPTAASIAWTALRDLTDPLGEAGVKIMGHVRIYAQRQYEAGKEEADRAARAPVDSVLEDAARWQALPAFFEEYQIDAMKLYRDIDAYLAEVRKQDDALILQLVEALEYHRAQTRPIDRTDEAITAGRARLEGKP